VLASDEALMGGCGAVSTTNHLGHVQMGPERSVSRGRLPDVHGVAGLRVVDASIMPDCVRAG
jgi:choline dehydrogenase-like flavoprotein